jgi:midasin
MALLEQDATMNGDEVSPGRNWIREAATLLLADLGCTSSTSSSPVRIPRIIFDLADSTISLTETVHSELLEALTTLLDAGLEELLALRFRPLILDLLARWLELPGDLPVDLWEKRLAVIAALAGALPELWRYV